jgi:hypothetical protein
VVLLVTYGNRINALVWLCLGIVIAKCPCSASVADKEGVAPVCVPANWSSLSYTHHAVLASSISIVPPSPFSQSSVTRQSILDTVDRRYIR